ncbi:hypothetical protein ANRL4_02104 [Anaerolineae bacterium]|nr:hypothetical protein ANRL4_02104 [Anaerolineae bacterium]
MSHLTPSQSSSSERRFLEKGVVAKPIGAIGWGLFAEAAFAPGDPIFTIDLQYEPRTVIMPIYEAFGDCDERSVTLVPNIAFCFTIEHPFWFVNHCCDSNSGFVNWGRVEEGKVPFAAHREIQPGEQITCDYSWITTPHDGSPEGGPWSMKCLCGHENCRHNITGYHALALPYQLAGMMPEELPTGRVPAHIVAYEPHLVEVLKAYPKLYRRYSDTLRQLQDVSKLLHQRLGL